MAQRDPSIISQVQGVLNEEAQALERLTTTIPEQASAMEAVCNLIHDRCGGDASGRLILTGIGKAGLIAQKIAATFASTGTPGFFVHPSEARHGDLGMIRNHDVVLAFSNSGSSEEVLAIIPSLRRIGVTLVAVCGQVDSPLAELCDHVISIGKVTEACPLNLAPSTSTTLMLALGDALALAVLGMREFGPENYGRFHPGGALGRRLMTCGEAMRIGDRVATAGPTEEVSKVMQAIGRARSGSAVIIDDQEKVLGIFTDGDLRRALSDAQNPGEILNDPVEKWASMPCRCIGSTDLLEQAMHLCAEHHFEDLPVVSADGLLLGLLDLQDLVHRGFEVQTR